MIYQQLGLPGLILIEMEPVEDQRGFFARAVDREEMQRRGLVADFDQESVARNIRRGTLRGLHYQRQPHDETKLVYCTRGKVFDVVVDARPSSPDYGRWISIILDAQRPASLYIPSGFAHGYQTLEDETDVYYHIAPVFAPEAAAGFNAHSAKLSISWPLEVSAMSERDLRHPDFE